MKRLTLFITALMLTSAGLPAAADDAATGKAAWERDVIAKDGQPRSCVTCHGSDPTQAGKHVRTGKPIKPMAPSAEASRFSDQKKVDKWFKRNCKWTWGRECSADEQRAIRAYLYTF